MPLRLANVTFDATDANRLARFWAEALGYTVDGDYPELIILAPPQPGLPGYLFFRGAGEKSGKNRVHLDYYVDPVGDDPQAALEAEVTRLESLGATRLRRYSEHGITWWVMHDPEGNELCLAIH